jgi:phytoene dehydrogenase-like protein
MARAGLSVTVLEAEATIGGGTRSAELTLPGFTHDICSAIHPMAVASPFLRTLPLREHGLEWIHPAAPVAHPFDDGTAALLERSLEATGATLSADAEAWKRLFGPFLAAWPSLHVHLLSPLRLSRHALSLASFGLKALRSARAIAESHFHGQHARALFAGTAGHGMLPLDKTGSAAIGLVIALAAHAVGWPFPRGGAQKIAAALASYLRSLGGKTITAFRVHSLRQLPPARVILCDLTPRQLLGIAGHLFPPGYRRKLARYRYGMGAFKVDWALDGPIPWKAPECARAGTVHLGGTLEEIAESEAITWKGGHPQRPLVLLAQHTLFDPTRAPAGRHTVWAYCHVPNGSSFDMLGRIENQIERFAPGFRDRILARSVMPPAELERRNPNLIGGDISGGVQDLAQTFSRPTPRYYATPLKELYICSSSTPPGGGVHGMCGYFAARLALRKVFGAR